MMRNKMQTIYMRGALLIVLAILGSMVTACATPAEKAAEKAWSWIDANEDVKK